MPAGNFLLCFSVLLSGASLSKVLQVFKNMGVSCITLKTYFKHQAVSSMCIGLENKSLYCIINFSKQPISKHFPTPIDNVIRATI